MNRFCLNLAANQKRDIPSRATGSQSQPRFFGKQDQLASGKCTLPSEISLSFPIFSVTSQDRFYT